MSNFSHNIQNEMIQDQDPQIKWMGSPMVHDEMFFHPDNGDFLFFLFIFNTWFHQTIMMSEETMREDCNIIQSKSYTTFRRWKKRNTNVI